MFLYLQNDNILLHQHIRRDSQQQDISRERQFEEDQYTFKGLASG